MISLSFKISTPKNQQLSPRINLNSQQNQKDQNSVKKPKCLIS